ncbi:hypothetical protein G6F22_018590 [Rhizopus arrhizus]|nr:hypothetical protein G6F22_018590 [Rhizopus arrhizus]
MVGPVYGFFALGFSMYFASQGAGRLKWPLIAGCLRLLVAVGAGGVVLHLTGSLTLFFLTAAVAMCLYGLIILSAVAAGAWFDRGHLRRPQPLARRQGVAHAQHQGARGPVIGQRNARAARGAAVTHRGHARHDGDAHALPHHPAYRVEAAQAHAVRQRFSAAPRMVRDVLL